MYVLSSICAKPPNAPTMLSSIWKVVAVLWLNDCVKPCGLFGSPGMPPIPPYMPPPIPYPPYPPPYMPPPYMDRPYIELP